jgi:hypothetical protein
MNTESAAKLAATPSIEFLRDLADVLEKHRGGLLYTTADNGIYVTQGSDLRNKICIGWPENGKSEIRSIIAKLEDKAEKEYWDSYTEEYDW